MLTFRCVQESILHLAKTEVERIASSGLTVATRAGILKYLQPCKALHFMCTDQARSQSKLQRGEGAGQPCPAAQNRVATLLWLAQ